MSRKRVRPGDYPMSERDFLRLGLMLVNRRLRSLSVGLERFTGCYGVRPLTVAVLWDMLLPWTRRRSTCLPKHLLWALHFLTTYDTEISIASRFNIDEKTYRKWLWFMLEGIESLMPQLIYLNRRFENDTHQRAMMVVDGIDFQIREPLRNGFSSMWYSHKWNGPGLRYEVATCINTGRIVWIHGPFPAGRYADLRIFRLGLKAHLLPGEKVWADLGYRGEFSIVHRHGTRSPNHLEELVQARARHENVNGRLTAFGALHQFWRHDLNKHRFVFNSAAIIYQLETDMWGPHFDITALHDSAIPY